MVSISGEDVRQRLDAFLAHAANESEPSEEGLQLWDDLARSVESLVDEYWPPAEEAVEPDAAPEEDSTDAEPLRETNGPRHAHAKEDSWLVGFFQEVHGWQREPGDRLTAGQRLGIAGPIFMALVVVGALAYGLIYYVMHAEEFVVTRRTGQP